MTKYIVIVADKKSKNISTYISQTKTEAKKFADYFRKDKSKKVSTKTFQA